MLMLFFFQLKEDLQTLLSYTSNPIYCKSTAFVLLSVILFLLMNRYVDNYESVQNAISLQHFSCQFRSGHGRH